MDRKKIIDIAPFGVYPPINGGSIRINSINLELSKEFDIFLFSQGLRSHELRLPPKSWVTNINSNYKEYRFVNTSSLVFSQSFSKMKFPFVFLSEILKFTNPSVLKRELKISDLIQVEHPWQFKYAYSTKNVNVPIILVEHNFELYLQTQLLKSKSSNKFLHYVEKTEAFALEKSNAILSVSYEDRDRLTDHYDIDKSKIYVVPNGVDTNQFKPTEKIEKELLKQKLNLEGKKVVLFTGWAYPPNYEAVEEIISISSELSYDKDLVFLIVGKVGEKYIKNNNISTNNIIFTGRVNSVEDYYKVADVAINPMKSGSGSNLKMLEYLSSAIPTITTNVGARGLNLKKSDLITCPIDKFGENIEKIVHNSKLSKSIGNCGRKAILDRYDWKKIGEELSLIYKYII